MKTHACAAHGCDRQVPRNILMGRVHWYMVPQRIRDDVWAGYRTGDRVFHMQAIRAAQAAVAEREERGHPPAVASERTRENVP